jgi:hypothetical protein
MCESMSFVCREMSATGDEVRVGFQVRRVLVLAAPAEME